MVSPSQAPKAPSNKSRSVVAATTLTALLLGSLFSAGAASASPLATIEPADSVTLTDPVITYTIKPGDSLWAIAEKHGIDLNGVFEWNNLTNENDKSTIYPAQTIKLSAPVAVKPAENKSRLFSIKVKPGNSNTVDATHKVVAGDSVAKIAKKYNLPVASLQAWNGLHENSMIVIGRTLKLAGPVDATPTPAPKVASTPGNLSTNATPTQVKAAVTATARELGVDPALALAVAEQESGFRAVATSSVGALGTMQVMPANEEWVSGLAGRPLNLKVPADNITAGVTMLRQLVETSPSLDIAIASYYQGQHGVMTRGMFEDTKVYLAQVKDRMAKFD